MPTTELEAYYARRRELATQRGRRPRISHHVMATLPIIVRLAKLGRDSVAPWRLDDFGGSEAHLNKGLAYLEELTAWYGRAPTKRVGRSSNTTKEQHPCSAID